MPNPSTAYHPSPTTVPNKHGTPNKIPEIELDRTRIANHRSRDVSFESPMSQATFKSDRNKHLDSGIKVVVRNVLFKLVFKFEINFQKQDHLEVVSSVYGIDNHGFEDSQLSFQEKPGSLVDESAAIPGLPKPVETIRLYQFDEPTNRQDCFFNSYILLLYSKKRNSFV